MGYDDGMAGIRLRSPKLTEEATAIHPPNSAGMYC